MPGPSNFIPTSRNIAQYYREFFSVSKDTSGNVLSYTPQDTINHGISMGCTYTFPFMEFPIRWFPNSPEFYRGLSGSKNTWKVLEYFKLAGQKHCAVQPYTFNGTKIYEFLSDQVGSTLQTSSNNYYLSDWSITGSTGLLYNPWGLCGACAINEVWKRVCSAAKIAGVTVDYVMIDMEGTMFGSYNIAAYQTDTKLPRSIINDARYSQEFQGLSSWQYYFESGGGDTSFASGDTTWFNIAQTNYIPWDNASTKYVGKVCTLAHYNPIVEYFPNVSLSNYATHITDGFTAAKTGVYFKDFGANIGNASSTLHYTTTGGGDIENNNQLFIQQENSSAELVGPSSPLKGPRGRGILGSYRYAFLKALQSFRESKRNSPHTGQHPWIGAVNMWTEGYPTTVWTIGSASQSDANVLSNSWNYNNISSAIKGFSGPDGSTNGYKIQTPNTSGITCSLDYFLYGITPGATYTFSYYIDLNAGFTAQRFRIQQWKKYNYADVSGQGLTYTQTLPLGTGPFFKEELIGFSGNSGWTKVAFQFQGTTNPYVALSAYYARNGVTSGTAYGYTAYITNPMLEMEYGGVTSNISINEINSKRYTVSTIYPNIAYADAQKGYNPKLDAYFTRRGGNSAYYYEKIRHMCLMGAKAFGYFNGNVYIDYSISNGLTANPGDDWSTFYNKAAGTYAYPSAKILYTDFNTCLNEVNNLLGGYTATTALTGWVDWLGTYVANGAPVKGGTSWLWRITALPGYTTYCNGETLSTYGKVGTWVTTSGSTLAGISLYSNKWALPQEPSGLTSPLVDFNFLGMTGIASLTNAGFTFLRGSTASYINSQGKLVIVTGTTPRFAYDPNTLEAKGLLLEPSAINVLNWSESFANTGGANNNWVDYNLQRTTGNTSPSDSLNAILFTATGSNATLLASNSVGLTRERCLSFWMKGITGNESMFYTFDAGNTWNSITSLTTKWKRFEYGPNTGDQTVGFKFGNTGDAVYIWGIQLERSKSETLDASLVSGISSWSVYDQISSSYIPTLGATAQRNSEQLYMPRSGFCGWLGITYGTLIYEAENMHQGGMNITRDGSSWYGLVLGAPNSAYTTLAFSNKSGTGGVTAYEYSISTDPWYKNYQWNTTAPGARYKMVMSYQPQKFAISSNGYCTTTIGNVPYFNGLLDYYTGAGGSLTEMILGIGIQNTYATSFYGRFPKNPMYIRRFRYWNQSFPESLMKALSVADMEIFAVDNSVEYTWEKYREITDPYTFNLENSTFLS